MQALVLLWCGGAIVLQLGAAMRRKTAADGRLKEHATILRVKEVI